jgi:hypothetical protein
MFSPVPTRQENFPFPPCGSIHNDVAITQLFLLSPRNMRISSTVLLSTRSCFMAIVQIASSVLRFGSGRKMQRFSKILWEAFNERARREH